MKTPTIGLLLFLVAILLSGPTVIAGEKPPSEKAPPKFAGLRSLLDLVGEASIPSLDGLIRPEKMGVLNDNQFSAENNNVRILSGIRTLAGISVNVNITINRDVVHEKDKAKRKKKRRRGKKKGKKSRNRPA